jgi:membrane associated rhomboid family serine protease
MAHERIAPSETSTNAPVALELEKDSRALDTPDSNTPQQLAEAVQALSPESTRPLPKPWLSWLSGALILLIYCLTSYPYPLQGIAPEWVYWGALQRDWVWQGEWWRLLSYALLHANLYHVGANALAFWMVSATVERDALIQGQAWRFYALVFLLWAFAGLVYLPLSSSPVIGSSAIGYGLLAAYAIQQEHEKYRPLILILRLALLFGVLHLSQGVSVLGAEVGRVSVMGHLSGYLCGMVLSWLLFKPREA